MSPYIGRFKPGDVAAVIDAAGPLPLERLTWEDPCGAGLQQTTAAEAIVRHLEFIDAVAQALLSRQDYMSASALAKRFDRIESAAAALLEALDVGEGMDQMPPQVKNGLRLAAERHAERIGGFVHYPPTKITWSGMEIVEFDAEPQLLDNIDGIRQIHDWAAHARRSAKAKTQEDEDGIRSILPDELPLDIGSAEPISAALDHILHLWENVLERPIRTSLTPDGDPAGPLLRFAATCLTVIGLVDGARPLSGKALRKRIQRFQKARRPS